jgi:hypothetical protein
VFEAQASLPFIRTMLPRIATLASALGTVSCLSLAGLATNLVITGSVAPVVASSFKESNGWSSGDYFGPRSGAFSPALTLAADLRERNGYSSGDYFGPKG